MFMKAERQSEPTSAKVNAIPLRTREQEGEMLKIMLIIRVVIMSVNKCSVVMMGLSQRQISRRTASGSLLLRRDCEGFQLLRLFPDSDCL